MLQKQVYLEFFKRLPVLGCCMAVAFLVFEMINATFFFLNVAQIITGIKIVFAKHQN